MSYKKQEEIKKAQNALKNASKALILGMLLVIAAFLVYKYPIVLLIVTATIAVMIIFYYFYLIKGGIIAAKIPKW